MAATIASLGTRVLRRLGVTIVAASDRPTAGATVSLAQVGPRALVWLGVVAPEETPSTADTATALEKATYVHDSLVARGYVSWAGTAIPGAVSDDYVMLTALHLAPAFGKAGDAAQEPVREARIREFSMQTTAPAIAEQAVMDVHANLDAEGRVRWSCFDIPDYAEQHYVALAASLVAPQFGKAPDPAGDEAARRALARLIALEPSGAPVRADYF